jgi:hypothetical protein
MAGVDDILSALKSQNSPFHGLFAQDDPSQTAQPPQGQGQPINPDLYKTSQELQQRQQMAGTNLQNANDALINPNNAQAIRSPWQGVSLLANKLQSTGALNGLYGQLSGINKGTNDLRAKAVMDALKSPQSPASWMSGQTTTIGG